MRSALPYLLLAAMAGGSAACAKTRLPPPEKRTDCGESPDSDQCSDEGSEPVAPMDPMEPVIPFELACDEDGNLTGTGPFELVASGDDFAGLAIAKDGTVFATGTIDGRSAQAFRVVEGEAELVGDKLWRVGQMIVEDSQLIAAAPEENAAPAILMVNLTNQKQRMLDRMAGSVKWLGADEDAIYWVRQLETRAGDASYDQIWRGPWRSGESKLVAELDDSVGLDRYVALREHLYFFSTDYEREDSGSTLHRIAKDGSGGASTVRKLDESTGTLLTDGEKLFFAASDAPVAHATIMSVDVDTFETDALFELDRYMDLLLAHERYLYWAAYTDEKIELWRGPVDGRTEPERLGALEASIGSFAGHDDELYWITSCWREALIESPSHIVKLSL